MLVWTKDRCYAQLITNIALILKDDPEKCQECYSLYAGPEFSNERAAGSSDFRVDICRL